MSTIEDLRHHPQWLSPFGEEHEALRESVRRYVETELVPNVEEWERDRWVPHSVFERAAELGFLGLKYPEHLGGQGGDYLHEAVFFEELQRCGSGGLATVFGCHVGIATPPVWKFGTDDQHDRYLAPAIRGEKIGALAISEPGAGSDVSALVTRAERVAGGWVVNGEKTYITNGVRSDFLVTAVRTGHKGHGGLSFLIVDRGPGVTSSKLEKLGWHASDTATVAYEDVFVPESNLLGDVDGAFKLIMSNFQWERLLMALQAIGSMQLGWELTVAFAKERRTFGKAIAEHQVIAHKLVDLATQLHTCRCLVYDALRRFMAKGDATNEVTMAKLVTQRAAVDFLDACIQIHGGAGYMTEYKVERLWRDARLGPIGGGTDEIMREILAKRLLS